MIFSFTQRRGFTVLEVLIVLAAFGLLATFAALSLNGARKAMRDAQRISDVSVVRSALNEYWRMNATYPTSAGVNLGQAGTNTETLSSVGFTSRTDAKAPILLERGVPTGPSVNEFYRYHGSPSGYSIRFQTESKTSLGIPNVYYAHSVGIDTVAEDK